MNIMKKIDVGKGIEGDDRVVLDFGLGNIF